MLRKWVGVWVSRRRLGIIFQCARKTKDEEAAQAKLGKKKKRNRDPPVQCSRVLVPVVDVVASVRPDCCCFYRPLLVALLLPRLALRQAGW